MHSINVLNCEIYAYNTEPGRCRDKLERMDKDDKYAGLKIKKIPLGVSGLPKHKRRRGRRYITAYEAYVKYAPIPGNESIAEYRRYTNPSKKYR